MPPPSFKPTSHVIEPFVNSTCPPVPLENVAVICDAPLTLNGLFTWIVAEAVLEDIASARTLPKNSAAVKLPVIWALPWATVSLAPVVTTIGIYDKDGDMVAVAKLPQPIKNLPDYDVNFIVRFDT